MSRVTHVVCDKCGKDMGRVCDARADGRGVVIRMIYGHEDTEDACSEACANKIIDYVRGLAGTAIFKARA